MAECLKNAANVALAINLHAEQCEYRKEFAEAMTFFFNPLLPLHYEMIVIDPPWHFDLRSDKGDKKSPQAQYETMLDEEILAMPVSQLASMNCLIYLWAVSPKLPLAIACLKAWGFEYKSLMMWEKKTVNDKTRLGPGYRVRGTGEPVLVGTLGNPKQSYVPRTIFNGLAREHSRKPDEFYDICDRVMPTARKVDVFSRENRLGWDVFGDQAGHFNSDHRSSKKLYPVALSLRPAPLFDL